VCQSKCRLVSDGGGEGEGEREEGRGRKGEGRGEREEREETEEREEREGRRGERKEEGGEGEEEGEGGRRGEGGRGRRRGEEEEEERGEEEGHKDQQVVPTIDICVSHTTPHSHTYFLQEHISLRHLCGSSEGVLHNAHDGTVGLRGEDHAGHHHHLLDLCLCLQALGNMEVHLVSIKVCIVGCSNTGEGNCG